MTSYKSQGLHSFTRLSSHSFFIHTVGQRSNRMSTQRSLKHEMGKQRLSQPPIASSAQPMKRTMSTNILPSPRRRLTKHSYLLDLPNELLSQIIDYVAQPQDLKNMCLANVQLYDTLAPRLYRYLHLDLSQSHKGENWPASCSTRIGRLAHVRFLKLHLGSEDRDPARESDKERVLSDILRILQRIPENVLQSLEWDGPLDLRSGFVKRLYRRQRHMVKLTIFDNDLEALDLSRDTLIQTFFGKVTTLTLYKASATTQICICPVLQSLASHLECLTIEFEFNGDMTFLELNEVPPPNMGPLSRSLFSTETMSSGIGLYSKLQSLCLSCVCLKSHAADWRRFFECSRLKHLSLSFCKGAMDLIEDLTKTGTKLIGLQSFEIQHEDHGEIVATQLLDLFLVSLDPLEKLMINIRYCYCMPSPTSIMHHGRVLKVFSAHFSSGLGELCPDNAESVWDTSQLEQICIGCPHLKELSCAWPFPRSWAFGTSAFAALHRAFDRTIGSLFELGTLQITYLDNGIEANLAREFENESVTSYETDMDEERDVSDGFDERDYTFRWRKFDFNTFACNTFLMAAHSTEAIDYPDAHRSATQRQRNSKLIVLICGVRFPTLRPRMFVRAQEFHNGRGEYTELFDEEQDSAQYLSEISRFDMYKCPVFREP